ncbi:MAG: M23 family metallopeptidase [Flavobacteriales bacterium]
MRSLFFLLLFGFLLEGLPAQKGDSLPHPPLLDRLRLSGNFGELRPGHFHSGLDLKTNGNTGKPVTAIRKGQVSRIKIQEGGYGRTLYIDHPNGNTSVYAHLKRFAHPIRRFLRQVQYEQEQGPIDLYPGEGILSVERGDTIAFSGNSGSSGAPHLHFEIRKTVSEQPIDPLLLGFDVFDRRAPRFHGLRLIQWNEKGEKESKVRSTRKVGEQAYQPSAGKLIKWGRTQRLRFSVRVTDRASGTRNPLGVRALQAYIDGKLYYSVHFDTLDFSNRSYFEAHIDHPYLYKEGRAYHRCHVLPHNELSIYEKEAENSPFFHPIRDSIHRVRVEASDRHGNLSVLRFRFVSKKKASNDPPNGEEQNGTELNCRWREASHHRSEELELTIPPKALYQDHTLLIRSDSSRDEHELSPDHTVHDPSIPLQKPFKARIRLDTLPPGSKEKLYILSEDPKWGVRVYEAHHKDGWAVGKVKRFGELSVRVDSSSPRIRPLRTQEKIPKAEKTRFRFRVKDDLSGIESYEAYLGNRWRIPYYDRKNDLIIVRVSDPLKPLSEGVGKFELKVRDRAGNETSFIKKLRVE